MTEQSAGVSATVKWFNPTKGFGFVTALDTPRDALLHASVLAKQGKRWLPEGAELIHLGDSYEVKLKGRKKNKQLNHTTLKSRPVGGKGTKVCSTEDLA